MFLFVQEFLLPEKDQEGSCWRFDWPVFGISYNDALRYCSWFAEKKKLPLRLPNIHEWEKAARGGDMRIYPWGNHFDESFCSFASGGKQKMEPVSISSCKIDESPYGVRGMGGGISDFCFYAHEDGQIRYLT